MSEFGPRETPRLPSFQLDRGKMDAIQLREVQLREREREQDQKDEEIIRR